MTDPNMPTDKKGAEIYLKARMVLLAELLAESKEHDYTTLSQLSGSISNKQDDVNEELTNY